MFELNSLNSDERELEKIYVRQLESVLFSINQSVQDKVSEITTGLERNMNSMSDGLCKQNKILSGMLETSELAFTENNKSYASDPPNTIFRKCIRGKLMPHMFFI